MAVKLDCSNYNPAPEWGAAGGYIERGDWLSDWIQVAHKNGEKISKARN